MRIAGSDRTKLLELAQIMTLFMCGQGSAKIYGLEMSKALLVSVGIGARHACPAHGPRQTVSQEVTLIFIRVPDSLTGK